MSIQQASPSSAAPARRMTVILGAFTAAVFTSALLLFAVQPMFTRMVLPILGGSPSVWSVAMVFFQTMLLAGYAYAHLLTQARDPRVGVVVHLVLLVIAGLTLPLAIVGGWGEPPGGAAALWLLGLFTVSIGLPFFALAANNPLLQAWFVRTGHPDGKDPYFLYAASNVGSFLALISYPVLLEPAFTLRTQNLIWTSGFALLVVLIAWCGFILWRAPARLAADMQADADAPVPGWRLVARWLFLSAVPSGLLVAVTAHISTDVAAAPLLWVMPLSLYLLTWVLVFQRRPLLPHKWVLAAQPFAIFGLVALIKYGNEVPLMYSLGGHLLAFFVIAMAAHGELARTRPAAVFLTRFYVSLSAGGMIGGLFAGLLAPYTFSWIAEYPILIALAALCRPLAPLTRRPLDIAFWVAIVAAGLVLLVPGWFLGWTVSDELGTSLTVTVMVVAGVSLLLMYDPLKSMVVVAVALAMIRIYPVGEGRFETVRSFFGVHKLFETADGRYRVLMHGSTIHGAQLIRNEDGTPVTGRPDPISYYHPSGGMGQVIAELRRLRGGLKQVAVVGLGSGSLACHQGEGERWTFFEIDPTIIAIANDPRRFAFLTRCAPGAPIVLGDARLTLAKQPDHGYDLIIVDAYSSDAIPIHLATQEAMAIYKAKLAPGGVVMMHISNRHLELASVVVGIADANDLKTWVYSNDDEESDDENYIFTSEVAISAADEGDIGKLAGDKYWPLVEHDPAIRVWTDDYSNVLGAVLRKF